MKTVFFIRHAKSSWNSNASKDIDRPLNARGRRDAPLMAQILFEKIKEVDGIIKSPARRITETVQPFQELFGLEDKDVLTDRSIYEASVQDLLNVIEGAPDDWNTIFIFGHNPSITYIADHFGRTDIHNVPTCGVLEIKSDASNWEEVNTSKAQLISFYYPKMYLNE